MGVLIMPAYECMLSRWRGHRLQGLIRLYRTRKRVGSLRFKLISADVEDEAAYLSALADQVQRLETLALSSGEPQVDVPTPRSTQLEPPLPRTASALTAAAARGACPRLRGDGVARQLDDMLALRIDYLIERRWSPRSTDSTGGHEPVAA